MTAAAALAAQSFVEIDNVDIWWGVGFRTGTLIARRFARTSRIARTQCESAKAMSDAEVAALLDETEGKLTLQQMEHADDVMLERAGVISRERVHVGRRDGYAQRAEAGFDHDDAFGDDFRGSQKHASLYSWAMKPQWRPMFAARRWVFARRAHWLHERGLCGVFSSRRYDADGGEVSAVG